MTVEALNALIRSRRAVFPNMYNGEPIDRNLIEQILENANWAPTHRKTEPWRFKVFTGKAKESLGIWLAEDYKANVTAESFSARKYQKKMHKAVKSGAVVAICMQRDPEERLPEWEEMAAVACAVQNMWLTCTAMGLGCYWSTPSAINRFGQHHSMKHGEKCLGFLYMGNWNPIELPALRGDINAKVEWVG